LASVVDELYLTCYQHPDVQAMYAMFPRALKVYVPHGFDSVHGAEIEAHGRYFGLVHSSRRRAREALFDSVKRSAFSPDSLLPRTMRVDRAYSFNRPLPWASEQVNLSDALCREVMGGLYARLPLQVRGCFDGVAAEVGERALLAVLPPFDWPTEALNSQQRQAMAALTAAAARIEAPSGILIKPHPRNTYDDIATQTQSIRDSVGGIPLRVLDDYGAYPVEVVMVPFGVGACVSLGSSSCRPLRLIYGMKSYISEAALRELYSSDPGLDSAMRAWLSDNKGENVCL
jgi:hypothetical protein